MSRSPLTDALGATVDVDLFESASPQSRANSTHLHEAPVVHVSKLKKGKTIGGQKMLNNYIVLDVIGEGSYSKVKLCCHKVDHTYYALKIFDRSRLKTFGIGVTSAINKIYREIAILKKLRHPNIIALQEVIDDPHSNKLYLVFEYAGYGPLLTMTADGTVIPDEDGANTIPEVRCRTIIRDILSALVCAHENGVAHRDIKPENILVTEAGDVKLADFGVSSFLSDVSRGSREGTIAFLPPELLLPEAENSALDVDLLKADVWALGVSLFVMCSGKLPWRTARSLSDLRTLFHGSSLSDVICGGLSGFDFSSDLRDFLCRTISVSVGTRMTIFAAASHRWITGAETIVPVPHSSSNINLDAMEVENAVSKATILIASTSDVQQLPPKPRIYFRSVPWESELHFRRSGTRAIDSPSSVKGSFAFDDSVIHSLSSPVSSLVCLAGSSSVATLVQNYHERQLMLHVQLTPHAKPASNSLEQSQDRSSSGNLANSFVLPPSLAPSPARSLERHRPRRAFSQPSFRHCFARRVTLMGTCLPPDISPLLPASSKLDCVACEPFGKSSATRST